MAVPETFARTQSIFDIALIFATVLLIIVTFLRTRTLAERETRTMFAELERAEGAARQADQAKSAFLATMSHEIRTPMNGVLGMTDLLLEMPLGEQQRRFVDVIKTSGESLLSILNDILDYSKIEAGRMDLESAPFELRGLVEQAVELIAARGQEQRLVFIRRRRPRVPAQVVGDPPGLAVLMNLLGNAVKFTSRAKSNVGVTVRGRTPDTVALTNSRARHRRRHRARLRSSGCSSRSARPDASIAGSTAAPAWACDQHPYRRPHGGRLGVDSTLGFGSTFRLELELPCPRPSRRPPALAAAHPLVDPHARRREALFATSLPRAEVVGCGRAPAAQVAMGTGPAPRASTPRWSSATRSV